MKKFLLLLTFSCSFFYINSAQDKQDVITVENEIIQKELESVVRSAGLTLYIGSGCPYCRKVINFLRSNNLESSITIKDVWANKSFMDELTTMTRGKRTVPCLMLDATTKQYMHGSDAIVQTLQQLLI